MHITLSPGVRKFEDRVRRRLKVIKHRRQSLKKAREAKALKREARLKFMLVHVIKTKVVALEQKSRMLGMYRTGRKTDDGRDETRAQHEDMGWYVTFEGSRESLYLGHDKPANLEKGQQVEILIRPVGAKHEQNSDIRGDAS